MNTDQKAFFNPPVPQDRRGLPPGAALLPGRLHIVADVLVIDCWCPHCRSHHRHGWPTAHPTASEHRIAHCCKPGSPYTRGYWIAPDARYAEENRAVLRQFLDARPDIVAALAGS